MLAEQTRHHTGAMSESTSCTATRVEHGVLSPTLIAIGLGYFMVILDTTIVNVALPALRVICGRR
jgi:hypothetical protein